MCGITGYMTAAPSNKQAGTIIKMKQTLQCRGPDENGVYIEDHVAFGHTRLIVVDPEGGKQPMTKHYGAETYTIVSNGEVYNIEEVREKLRAKGHTFKSYSDTEILLTAYIEWKEHAVDHINGIFGFAVWSSNARTLYLARDRLGVKPLYYSFLPDKGIFLFGSEPKAILQHPDSKPYVTFEGVQLLLCYPVRYLHKTPFRDIYLLRPGCSIEVTIENGQLQKREWEYWKVKAAPHTDNLEQTVDKVRTLLRAAVERQLVSDVPLGSLLSGGIDSSSIAMFAADKQKRDGKDFKTFSLDFVDNDKYFKPDWFLKSLDGPYIRRMVDYFKFNHDEFVMNMDPQVELMKEAMVARDAPGLADVDTSMLWLFRNVKKQVTVCLSGECSDEIFGGYPWFHTPEMVWKEGTFPWYNMLGDRKSMLLDQLHDKFDPEKYVGQVYRDVMDEVPRLETDSPLEARMRGVVYMNIMGMMQALLDRKDLMSMRCGLEVRVPFADHELVQYVYNIPWAMKAKDGHAKSILRLAMRGLLPDEVVDRLKTPYPKMHDPKYTELVVERLREAVRHDSPIFQIFDEQKVREYLSGKVFSDKPKGMTGPAFECGWMLQLHHWMTEYKVELVEKWGNRATPPGG